MPRFRRFDEDVVEKQRLAAEFGSKLRADMPLTELRALWRKYLRAGHSRLGRALVNWEAVVREPVEEE